MVRFCNCRPLFCDQNTAEHITPMVAARLRWQLSNIYHAGLPGMYLPAGFTRWRRWCCRSLNQSPRPIFTSTAFSPEAVKCNASRCRRNINGSFVFTRQDGNVLTRCAVFGDCGINGCLNRGVCNALRPGRADNEVWLFRQVNRRRRPRGCIGIHRREIVRTGEVLRFSR